MRSAWECCEDNTGADAVGVFVIVREGTGESASLYPTYTSLTAP